MAVRKFKPVTPGTRHKIIGTFDEITTNVPEKSLVSVKKSSGGRNNTGKMTVRYIGGGHKRMYRHVDFKRVKDGVAATVKTIEYDPNRTARIALVVYADGEKSYILAPNGLQVGQTVMSGAGVAPEVGNTLFLSEIPLGTVIHNIELNPGRGAQLVRSAGDYAQLMAKDAQFAQVRLPSGEVRLVRPNCVAVIGQVGNIDHENVHIGKAGRTRHMGIRPTVRGSVMNPNDHPHGGGEGKSPVGHPGPMTPWGKPAMGLKTRKTKNRTNKYIFKRRNAK